MTVLEAIQRSTEFLAKKGVDSPRLHAELLLAHLLKLQRMQLYLNFERALGPAETDTLRELVKRRGQREPLQQILGSTSFCGLEIAVTPHVLVPRPETELLAERGWHFLNQLSSPSKSRFPTTTADALANGLALHEVHQPAPSPPGHEVREDHPLDNASVSQPAVTCLDFGTGSGCLAIALAANCPAAEIWAVDISAEALALAKQNAERNQVADRIHFLHADGLSTLRQEKLFHLIVSNPPYIPTDEINTLDPEVRHFEPRQALDGGADGLAYFRRLATEAVSLLQPGGRIMLEFGDGQAPGIREIFEQQNWIVEAVQHDYTQRPRILVAHHD